VTKADATGLAVDYLRGKEREAGIDLVLLDSNTIEKSFGWVFFYDSKRHVESGNFRDALAGNAPFVVTKADGRVHETGTARPLDEYLRRFERYEAGDSKP
jgi:hypothetical protein